MTFDSAGNEAIPNPEMMGNDRNNDDKFSHVLVMFPVTAILQLLYDPGMITECMWKVSDC